MSFFPRARTCRSSNRTRCIPPRPAGAESKKTSRLFRLTKVSQCAAGFSMPTMPQTTLSRENTWDLADRGLFDSPKIENVAFLGTRALKWKWRRGPDLHRHDVPCLGRAELFEPPRLRDGLSWRRGWDSNPRNAWHARRIISPVPLTTRPPLPFESVITCLTEHSILGDNPLEWWWRRGPESNRRYLGCKTKRQPLASLVSSPPFYEFHCAFQGKPTLTPTRRWGKGRTFKNGCQVNKF